jgi:hypothetical protein
MEAMAMSAQASGKTIAIPPFVANAFADAMSYVFLCSMVIVAIGFITIFFIPQIQLRGRGPEQASQDKTIQATESALADTAPAPADPAPMPQRER